MSVPTQDGQRPARAGGRGRPIAFLVAGLLGLGGLGVATGVALGAAGDTSPRPASADQDCPGRGHGGVGGQGFGGQGFGPRGD